MSFWGELKRRNVFKVGVAYVIVGWLILQVASIAFPALNLPGWVLTFVMVILIIGLPLALLFTWAFVLTADGIKRTEQVTLKEKALQVTGRKPNYLMTELDDEESQKTVAILPFSDLSPEKNQEYFADGMAEELINKLSHVKDLQITARTSSFYFKGKNENICTIGETLGVTYLLEGSVRKSENQLRVTAQLIKAADGYHLFSESYDRELEDIFSIQDDIAKAVTTALSVTLGVGEFSRPGMTRNIKAYDGYLRAFANFYKATLDSILAAIEQLKSVLEIDQDFGSGWLALSKIYYFSFNLLPPGETVGFKEMAAEAMKRARAVSPDMPELLIETASEHQENGNWLEAERIYWQILDEKTNVNIAVNRDYGIMLLRVGRNREALLYLQRAKRMDPLEIRTSFYLSVALFNSKKIDEAFKEAKCTQALEGFDFAFTIIEFLVALEGNDIARAAASIDSHYDLEGDYPDESMLILAKILQIEDKEAALSELRELSNRYDISPLNRMHIAHVASVLGDPELALENFLESKEYDVPLAVWHPIHGGIRQLPVFKTWIRKIGVYDYWRASGKWGDLCRPVGDDDFECD